MPDRIRDIAKYGLCPRPEPFGFGGSIVQCRSKPGAQSFAEAVSLSDASQQSAAYRRPHSRTGVGHAGKRRLCPRADSLDASAYLLQRIGCTLGFVLYLLLFLLCVIQWGGIDRPLDAKRQPTLIGHTTAPSRYFFS